MVEFEGKPLDSLNLPANEKLNAEITSTSGKVSYVFVEPVGSTKRWRVQFDLTYTGNDPIELRAFLKRGKQTLTESWLYQFEPR